jgi:beta-lactam-binding protein with PASTA domain
MFKFITSRPLWVNILIGITIVVMIFLLFIVSLNWITRHGDAKLVPAVTGKNINDVQKLLADKGFDIVIQDSVYYDSLPPGIVIKQVPDADQVVKVNRTVYVTINRFVPPDISMPNLVGFSYRNAELQLRNLGLKVGDTTFKPDFAKNSVLEQLIAGNPVKAGDKVKVGTAVDLILGSGLGNEDMPVPKLIGLTLSEAKILLEQDGLVLGVPMADATVRDTANAYIIRQSPPQRNESGNSMRIRPGQMIDVWLTADRPNTDSVNQSNQQPLNPPQEQ